MDKIDILVTTMPMRGHIEPTVPIAKELASAGHRVSWYVHKEFESRLERLGIHVIRLENRFEYSPVDFTLRNFFEARRRMIAQAKDVFVDWSLEQYEFLDKVIAAHKPDIILTDCVFFVSLLLAEKHRIPCAVFGPIPYTGSSEGTAPYGMGWQPASTSLGKIIRRLAKIAFYYGLLRPIYGYAAKRCLDQGVRCPLGKEHIFDTVIDMSDIYLQGSLKEFEYALPDIPDKVAFIGPSLGEESVDEHAWIAQLGKEGRPVVFATQGSVQDDPELLLRHCREALEGQNLDLIIANRKLAGNEELIQRSGKLTVIAKREVDYHGILPICDVFVTNGGFHGVNAALKHGVPMVVAGRSDDKGEVAARVARAGVGINLRTSTPSPKAIKKAVNKILQDEDYKRKVMKMRETIRRCRTPQIARTHLESLARSWR